MQTLSQYLDAQKISQAQFAQSLGVKQPTVSRWLNGAAPKRNHMTEIERLTKGAVPVAIWFSEDAA